MQMKFFGSTSKYVLNTNKDDIFKLFTFYYFTMRII